jgi:hypothetical protein
VVVRLVDIDRIVGYDCLNVLVVTLCLNVLVVTLCLNVLVVTLSTLCG